MQITLFYKGFTNSKQEMTWPNEYLWSQKQSDAFIPWFPGAKTISYQNEGTEGADALVHV